MRCRQWATERGPLYFAHSRLFDRAAHSRSFAKDDSSWIGTPLRSLSDSRRLLRRFFVVTVVDEIYDVAADGEGELFSVARSEGHAGRLPLPSGQGTFGIR